MLSSPPQDAKVSCEVRFLIRCGRCPELYALRPGVARLGRGDWVICRTQRGIELGEVLTEIQHDPSPEAGSWGDAKWIRGATEEDRFLLQQLETLSQKACEECQKVLEDKYSDDVLIDVEPLLDGRTLYFHFLGNPSEETESLIDELSSAYQASVAQSRFAQLLEKGCGPGCGTPEKSGCSTGGGCAVCAIAGGCTKTAKRQAPLHGV